VAPVLAGVLFLAIVPLRLQIFNLDGPALAIFVLTVVVLGLVGGVAFRAKSGWCASVCPVLPVERLYGQSALIEAPHLHCESCNGCVKACYDVMPRTSLDEMTRGKRAPFLISTASGIFVGAFPGFVLGYFTVPVHASLFVTYVWILAASALSLLLVQVLEGVGFPRPRLVRLSGAVAAGLYYWFTVPAIARQFHEILGTAMLGPVAIALLQTACLALAAGWLVQAWRTLPARALTA
jgi:nitrite reductase (NADH) large subunit